jgi:two-component system cell cycle sensor histidine kinase/response regulator CckA
MGTTILVVDDDASIIKMATEFFEPLGYEILTALNGKEALEISRKYEEKIDLLLTDVVMSSINGIELAKILQQERPYMLVILMSGYPADIVAPKGIIESNIHFINKPLRRTTLTNIIQTVLDKKATDLR